MVVALWGALFIIYMREQENWRMPCYFFREVPPPHTSENVWIKFEDELDHCGVSCLQVVTDNASNMKSAFQVTDDENDDLDETFEWWR